ncbi:MAG TPA: LacI family DNA-binding transcriptional regulator [Armatimonadaceae bacterium]|nr:LacI family DNA-binding transcriptional regulator [Armatimonadaceae bacterium]
MAVRQTRPTLRDVAEAAGVSKTTAVFVLNERPNFSIPQETRTRVQNAAKRLGYRRNGLAAALSHGRTGSIGLVVNAPLGHGETELGASYLLGVILGATQAASAARLRLTTIGYDGDNPPTPDEVTDNRVDGLIVVGVMEESFTRAVYDTGFPCVTVGSGYALRRVTADNVGGATQAVEHLIALGHRRIAYASPGLTEADIERRQGWQEAMRRHGLPSDGLEQDWEPLLERLLARGPDAPTAVFCRNDSYAALLIPAARKAGLRVPEDVSVVGFDSGIIAQAMELTSVRNPLPELTVRAVEMLTGLIAGKETETLVTLPTELNVRRSTAPPAAPALGPKES